MPYTKQTDKFFAAILGLFTLAASSYGQGPCPADVGCHRPSARYMEYGNVRWRDERDVLDAFARQLHNSPNEIAYIVIYAGLTSCVDEAKKRALRAKNYLVHTHGIPAERVLWKDGGFKVDLSTELWLFARGRTLPEPNPQLSRAHVRVVGKCKHIATSGIKRSLKND